ncbi:FAD-dependent oxidoreductase [Dechloromonas denitrificans]|uniref:FAD-dependent oxidoreductase n=1 Tax=Dechloromonas denitrificans TaxID=281362 RepID=UPI001CF87C7E|nr:FAD-dependent oxidoreductase [Dechloromonas denitrificans]UCV02847.1 FAD-dependent oxidoreductase [Dechloromonas denitrificans]
MIVTRRQFLLGTACLLGASTVMAAPVRPKVVIVGGGWGGLAAARQLASQCDVLMIERNPDFVSLPLSNRWLAGLDDGRRLRQDYRGAAQALGYRFLQGEVLGIDRGARRVDTSHGSFPYDWLIVAAGIAEADPALFAGDQAAARHTREHFPSAYTAGRELDVLKQKLAGFSGGEFLMTLPLAPYRCPPAPYERAVIIAQAIKTRGLKARLTLVEPNAPWPAYQRVFSEVYRDQVNYLPNTRLRQLDPYRRIATLDIDEINFTDALIMPQQQAADICRRSGLVAADSAWAAVDPRNFGVSGDERLFVIGDSVGAVSSLFGHYPKTGELASRMGQIVATEIAGRIAGQPPVPALPESTCFAYVNLAPAAFTRIVTRYRLRGDGLVAQTISQTRENNPQGEDDAWLDARHGELFGPAARR